jgi:hypothetical protein
MIPNRVYCLNLDSMPERWGCIRKACTTSRILSQRPPTRYRATPIKEHILQDYWSHWPTYYATRVDFLRMIEKAYVEKMETLLILEDDTKLTHDFDNAYEAACRDLPPKWMGLWLGGHNTVSKATKPFSKNLSRLSGILSTHAVLLSRRGMHRVYSHVMHQPKMIADWATKELQGLEPHFYCTPHEIVTAYGTRKG